MGMTGERSGTEAADKAGQEASVASLGDSSVS